MRKLLFLSCSLILVYFGLVETNKKSSEIKEDNFYVEKSKKYEIEIDSLLFEQESKIRKEIPNVIISQLDNSINVTMNESVIYFDLDSHFLNEGAREKLLPLIDVLDKRNIVTISGYTCDLGEDDYNLRLSKKRAESVKNFIQYKKPSISKIDALGYGEKYPVTENTDQSRGLNRRVEVKLEVEPSSPSGMGLDEGTEEPNDSNKISRWNSFMEKYN